MPTDSVSSSKPTHAFKDNFFADKQDSAVTTSPHHIQLSQPSAQKTRLPRFLHTQDQNLIYCHKILTEDWSTLTVACQNLQSMVTSLQAGPLQTHIHPNFHSQFFYHTSITAVYPQNVTVITVYCSSVERKHFCLVVGKTLVPTKDT